MNMTLYATGVRRAELCRFVGLRGLLDHYVDHRCWNRDVRPGRGAILQQPLDALRQKSPSPQRRQARADLQFFADLLVSAASLMLLIGRRSTQVGHDERSQCPSRA
jgi:hypothetical protein